jgi:hypothetical protein
MIGGKFSHPIDKYLWALSLDGAHDEEAGDVQEVGAWHALFTGALIDRGRMPSGLLAHRINREYHTELKGEDVDALKLAVGAILTTDELGFVEARLYADEIELRDDWAAIEAAVEQAYLMGEEGAA